MEGRHGNDEYKKGLWTVEEDRILMEYVKVHGKGKWNRIAKMSAAGLKRCGKSCRLRWMNYLSPSVKRGDFSEDEEDLIIRLHNLLGNRWSLIAGRVPGRTDNQVKNHWNTYLSKKLGIKKEKNKVCVNARLSSRDLGSENRNIFSKFNCNETFNDNAGEIATETVLTKCDSDDHDDAFKFIIDRQEDTIIDDNYATSFQFSSDDLSSHIAYLMEPLDAFSLDHFVWDGL
ncbi:hypothetical protein I3843_11G026500 [Carya illinoinensis]|uniref:Transcription factor WER-like n=1 Tax=Carya illinoinensis TaxID=32201 RepID=A0A8T1P039_CARIL|nr:transcription factor WER-like isoform X1 [Carya illinoinensis]KAG2678919.1 hypothetical protein I3760_11G026200 [Carya illinoinensis]KAG6635211.1 hypothetical protein CIPAW_11G026800 [Carya illinoinensis]KAG7954585.1 hypothetical protein I3843_11G026500 [Carya illinoinensis]